MEVRTWNPWLGVSGLGIGTVLIILAGRSGLGQTNLALRYQRSNDTLLISLTNAITNGRYDLFTVAAFPTGAIPWSIAQTGAPGQVNFSVPLVGAESAFFMAATNDLDGDGIPNFEDANWRSTTNDLLSITIDSPANNSTLQ